MVVIQGTIAERVDILSVVLQTAIGSVLWFVFEQQRREQTVLK